MATGKDFPMAAFEQAIAVNLHDKWRVFGSWPLFVKPVRNAPGRSAV